MWEEADRSRTLGAADLSRPWPPNVSVPVRQSRSGAPRYGGGRTDIGCVITGSALARRPYEVERGSNLSDFTGSCRIIKNVWQGPIYLMNKWLNGSRLVACQHLLYDSIRHSTEARRQRGVSDIRFNILLLS
jgi:hypothetical protein